MKKDTADKLKALVAEGDPLLRFALGSLTSLHPCLELVAEVGDAPAVRAACLKEMPEIVVLDLEVPRGDGFSLLREIRKLCPKARVLAVSRNDDAHIARRALRAGALGFLSLHEEGGHVLSALERMVRGQYFVSARVENGLLGSFSGGRAKQGEAAIDKLSDRELKVFRLLGGGLGATKISKELGVSVKTVETHQQRIKDKLNIANGADLRRRATIFAARAKR